MLEAAPVTVFILDTIMRFRGTNILLPDKDEPLTRERLNGLLKGTTPPVAYRKPRNIITVALEKNRDNSILALLLHTKYRLGKTPEKQAELQAAFVDAVLHRKHDKLASLLVEPLRTQLLDIVKGDLGNNLAKAVHMAKSGKATVQQAAIQNDVTSFDVNYMLAYLKGTKK